MSTPQTTDTVLAELQEVTGEIIAKLDSGEPHDDILHDTYVGLCMIILRAEDGLWKEQQ